MEEFYAEHRSVVAVAGGILAASAGFVLYRWLSARQSPSSDSQNYPADTVILHHIGRSLYAPANVPFAVKLETYLRMAKIPHECEFGLKRSSKNKYPWMMYNGEEVADSSFCIKYLNEHRNIDLNAWMTEEQKGAAVAFQRMVEENLYWVCVLSRWVTEIDEHFVRHTFPFRYPMLFVKLMITPRYRKMAYAQGIGRHSMEEVNEVARKDLTAISNFLGSKKKFLMGDQPCEEDCAVFGQLSQLYYNMPGSAVSAMIKADFPRVVDYCDRMKDSFWPDWVECTTQGGTAKATR
ncbi:hypothetical protein ACOMHN_025306 [Nucella lapillus]